MREMKRVCRMLIDLMYEQKSKQKKENHKRKGGRWSRDYKLHSKRPIEGIEGKDGERREKKRETKEESQGNIKVA
jgi:hypothetical protein